MTKAHVVRFTSKDCLSFDFSPEGGFATKKRGQLFLLFTGLSESDLEKTRETAQAVRGEYYRENESSAFFALKEALGKTEGGIAAASFVDGVVYSAIRGRIKAMLFRSGSLVNILEGNNDLAAASGHPALGDIFLLWPKQSEDGLVPALSAGEFQKLTGKTFVAISFVENGEAPSKPRIKNRLKALIGKRLYVRKGEMDLEDVRKRKTTATVGVVLLALLAISIGFGAWQQAVKTKKAQYEDRLQRAVHDLGEARTLFPVNPEIARDLFYQSREVAYALREDGVEDAELSSLLVAIEESEEEVLGQYKAETQVFVDLSLLSDGFSGDDMASGGETIFVLDKSSQKLAKVEVDTKSAEIFAGSGQVKDPIAVASYSERVFIQNDGVDEVDENGNRKQVIENFDSSMLPYAYAGNFYAVVPGESEILRYPGIDTEFVKGRSWLAKSVETDLSGAKGVTVDGNIWVHDGKRIRKFAGGSPQNFAISGVFPEIGNITAIYANEETEYLYILDTSESRIVVVDKEGGYRAQYFADELGGAKDLMVSETQSVMVILTGPKLISISLKH